VMTPPSVSLKGPVLKETRTSFVPN
jgi:hypothetical protein